MLSILIPIYNFDIRQLVHDLHEQLIESAVEFEILCFDDNSKQEFKIINRHLITSSPHHITYSELPKNLGRARIRNALAQAAQYPYLLFMDCDSKVVSPHYIQTYLTHLQADTLLYGGRSYATTPPDRLELHFHWHYGTQREQTSAAARQLHPYHAFMTNNFLIPKVIYEQIRMDERLTQYGHEDTLFGMELQKRQIKILHLDNPLEHIGLEELDLFLKKTKAGIQNLAFLAKQYPELETRLLNNYRKLKKTRLTNITQLILKISNYLIIRQLKSKKPDLRWFDVYKLQLFIEAMKSH